jgi:ubiquinone/menaquinone biosynthesis C-methylase UbiE
MTEKINFKQAMEEDPMFYFKYAHSRGVDYNFYGDWQKQYAKMIINICEIVRRTEKAKPVLLDVGCACGVNTRAFKEIGLFKLCMGCDLSKFMIDLGKKTHGFSDEELFVASAQQLNGVKTKSVDFIHCTSVLEHCTDGEIHRTLGEFNRVLTDEGIIFINVPALKPDQDKETVERMESDITHVTIKPYSWWEKLLGKRFEIEPGIYEMFENDKHSPDNSGKSFFDYYNKEWTFFLLSRG